jgi:hypothetical protein
MKPGERIRDYTNWFFENCNTCIGVRDDQVVDSYKIALRYRKVFEKIHESGATKVAPLMEVVNKLIDTEEALVNQFDHDGKQDAGTSGAAGDSSLKFCKRPSEVLVADGRQPSTFNVEEFNMVLDSPCTFHEGGTHIVRECQQFKRVFRAPEDPKRPRSYGDRSSSRCYNNNRHDDWRHDNHPPEDRREERDLPPPPEIGNPNGPFQHAKRSINIIVGSLKSSTSTRRYRKDNCEQPITFSRADHWVHIPDTSSYTLVVEPIIEGALLAQTLIDGGSGLNVIFVDTLKKMDFNFKRLTDCDEPFFGIVPNKAAYPMGRVSLSVTFGTEENFRTKYLSFEVADFKSSYHAILGRPMLARFMAVPHYTYLVMKMPAPKEVIIVYGDLLISFKCDNKALEIATTNACFGASAVIVVEAKKVDPSDLTIPEQKCTENILDAMPSMKKACLGLADPAKTVVIGDELGEK